MSAAVTVSAYGDKLPIIFLKKGKDINAPSHTTYANLCAEYGNEFELNESGFMTSKMMLKQSDWVWTSPPFWMPFHRPQHPF